MAVTTINIDSQVLTFANLAAFPITGTVKTIYIAEDTNFQYYWDGSQYVLLGSVGTVTSVGLTMPSAFTVANSPITSSGDIAVTGAGLASQYVRGDGALANFPTNGGGGSAVNYYLNGSVNQGTFGGDTYYELSKTPIIGAGTNFTRNNAQGNGYIASFITDAGDPNLLNIPAGNWALEFYFNANSGGGSPSFYGELYKVSNLNVFTLIASGSTNPEGITQGTTIDQYFTSIPVPQTTLLATDRLAIRVFVNTGGRNITLHTEDNNLCQVITTFSTGLNALNGLTAQVQNFAVGTSGTDFAINSATDTHTFNLPTASALNRGALSSLDWSTFNGKVNTGAITGSGLTMATARLLGRSTAGSGAVEEITIGSGLTLSAGTLTVEDGVLIDSGFQGFLVNGKIQVTVTSNNLTVALKTLAGTDPSSGNPVYCRINDTVRTITAALSVTRNAGTNWFNLGFGVEWDYFVYLGYNSTDGVTIAFSPYIGNSYGEFSTTTTNIKHLAVSTSTNAVSTDYYEIIGRFAATLGVTASFNWSVPTFTAINLIQRPVYETRLLFFSNISTVVGFSSFVSREIRCKIINKILFIYYGFDGTSNSTALTFTAPFINIGLSLYATVGIAINNGVVLTSPAMLENIENTSLITVYRTMNFFTWTGSGQKLIIGSINYII